MNIWVVSTVMNSAAMNIGVQGLFFVGGIVCVHMFSLFLGMHLGVELLAHTVTLFLTF